MVEIKNLEYVGFALVGLEVSSLKTNVLLPGVAEDWTIAFFVTAFASTRTSLVGHKPPKQEYDQKREGQWPPASLTTDFK